MLTVTWGKDRAGGSRSQTAPVDVVSKSILSTGPNRSNIYRMVD